MHHASLAIGLLSVIISSCGGGAPRGGSSATTQEEVAVSIITPARDSAVAQGTPIALRWDTSADSCQVFFNGTKTAVGKGSNLAIETSGTPLGVYRIRVKAWRNGASGEAYRSITVLANAAPREYGYRVVKAYPHDETAYTQGLLFHNGYLYESTGQRGASTVRRVELSSGKVLQEQELERSEFGEGMVLHDGSLYQLTWTSHKCHVYDLKTLTPIGAFYYSTQGWGLESDGTNLYLTDGTENIYVLDPSTFRVVRTIQAYTNEGPQRMLNELEFIDGLLYANVYLTDEIVAIEPTTGAVVRRIHLDGLLPKQDRTPRAEVLNGIAYDAERKAIYLTGKYWTRLFHVEFVAK